MSNRIDADRRTVLLVEYQKAQDSAEHHDQSVGASTSLWLASAVLIGFVLNALTSKHAAHYKSPLIMVIVLGILINVLVVAWVSRALVIKNQKYERCKEIERLLDMKQHTRVPAGRQWQQWVYYGLMLLFVATWAVLLAEVWRL